MATTSVLRPLSRNHMSTARKDAYKTPPTTITNKFASQQARRTKALEDQKRRRAQRVDSSRQLDFFADLNLGPSDDEDADAEVLREGVGSFASMVGTSTREDVFSSTTMYPSGLLDPTNPTPATNKPTKKSKTKKKQKKSKNTTDGHKAPNAKYADKCMYAELLEMQEPPSSSPWDRDGLPEDLESGWVAVAPVPVGKRCLAVTHQSSGLGGVVPNTSLHTRVLGKSLLHPFPSPLPPQTILDCILDPNWKENGILHVLDVVQWKGQDVGDCESAFRFWWRDTRLGELPKSLPPMSGHGNTGGSGIPMAFSSNKIPNSPYPPADSSPMSPTGYTFPYPTTFLPVPYHTNTTLPALSSEVIPLARSQRNVSVSIPLLGDGLSGIETMDVDATNSLPSLHQLTSLDVSLQSDGLLLYVSQASYEPGTSPLSSWIPILGYPEMNATGRAGKTQAHQRPLDLFEKLVRRRSTVLALQTGGSGSITIDASSAAEVDMDEGT